MIQIDIDMPKRCEECPLCVDYDCIIHERITDEYYDTLAEQYAHCPLNVPSAQPEIIRCHSCKHWTRTIGEMRGFGLGICDFHNAEYVTCNGFCHWAERREQDG
jgi:hypothetical protein